VIDLRRAYRACLEAAGERIDPIEADRTIPAEMTDFLAGGAKTMANGLGNLRNPVADEPMGRG